MNGTTLSSDLPSESDDRAAAEEEYAKRLTKISKMPLGTKECGTLKASLVSVKAELEAMGNAHAEVAAGMRRELEEAVISTSNLIREKRKLVSSWPRQVLISDSKQYRKVETNQTSSGTTTPQAKRQVRRRLHQSQRLHSPTKYAIGQRTG